MMKSLEKRLQKLEAPLKTVSIFADWCRARNSNWNGAALTDGQAFDEWIEFQQTATKEQYNDEKLNPDVGDFSAGLGGNQL